MLNWLKRKKESDDIPRYSVFEANPCRSIPPDLDEQERSDAFLVHRDMLEKALLVPGKRPQDYMPLFTELLIGEAGVPSIPNPARAGKCLPVFSSPFRAADYARICFASAKRITYLSSSSIQLLAMMGDLKAEGFDSFTIDRCPRCSLFTAFSSESMKSAGDIITVWAIGKATEMARLELYLGYALDAARAGRLEKARDVALECVGHVSPEDPRSHLLLAKIGIGLGDQVIVKEARSFLRYFRLPEWEGRLDEVERLDSPDFSRLA